MSKETELYVPTLARIDKVTQETSEVKTFKVRMPLKHEPGQFVQLSLLGIGEAPVSIASSSPEFLELTVKNVGAVTDSLFRLQEGDKVGIRGPYGHGYPMNEFKGKDIIIIGGGTGAASLRGVLKYIENNKKSFGSVDIFLGYRSPADILFKKDNDRWRHSFNFNITVDKPDDNWQGNTGVITTLLNKAQFKRINSAVLACGPPIMIKFVVQDLQAMGFTDQQIWVSLERMMKCGFGKCGHCMVQDRYVCKDGPVFNYLDAKYLED
ncbi:MAG: FAD/NAD(P)-binding protein [Candidatus Woesearchaeota archaeon]